MIEHLPGDIVHSAIKEMRRVLKRGGRIIIATPNRYYLRTLLFGRFGIGKRRGTPKHFREYSMSELKSLMTGFCCCNLRGIYLYAPALSLFKPFRKVLLALGSKFPWVSWVLLYEGIKCWGEVCLLDLPNSDKLQKNLGQRVPPRLRNFKRK